MNKTFDQLNTQNQLLKMKLKAAKKDERAPIEKKIAKNMIFLQPHLISNERLNDPKFLQKEFTDRIQAFAKKWVDALKSNPLDEGLFRQLKRVCEKLKPLNHEDKISFLEMKPLLKYMDSFKPKPSQNKILVNEEYTHVEKRQSMAKSQWNTAIDIIKDGAQCWGEEPHMFLMYLTDSRDHMTLGYELLCGDPKKIDEATSMDTASREQMSNAVWSWTQNVLHDTYKKDEFLIKSRKEKAQLEEALALAVVDKKRMHL